MNFRIAALCGALALVLTACPGNNGGNDGGTDGGDGGTNTGTGACTGGCGPNQVCDEAAKKCVDGCHGGCSVGQLCVKQGDTFACVTPQTSCSGNACEAGQTSCVDGNCSCLDFNTASRDTCSDDGKVCHQSYNAAASAGGSCENPKTYEFCKTDCASGDCGTCPTGQGCDDRLFQTLGICAHICDQTRPCAEDELCYGLPSGNSGFCYPKSLFGNEFDCRDFGGALPDGGVETVGTFASQKCFKVDQDGNPTETTSTGTCTWAFFRTDTRVVPFAYCRSAGPIPLGGACKTEPVPLNLNQTCATGLECAPVGHTGDGMCLPICNARLSASGQPSQPACAQGSACVNVYRMEDDVSVVGACMKECNVFSTAANYGCADVGTTPTACVPASPQGTALVTSNGKGFCAPMLPNAGAEGDACVDMDPMTGAACQGGLVCTRVDGEAQARCVKPCDVECSATDGGAPARCATEANATCGTGKSCTRVTGTTGATLGFCL